MLGIAIAFFVGATVGLLAAALLHGARTGDESLERLGLRTSDHMVR